MYLLISNQYGMLMEVKKKSVIIDRMGFGKSF